MGVIAKDDNQITLYFNSKTSLGQQTLPYVKAAEKKVRTIDISKTTVTGTQWSELADGLNLPISELVNKDNPDFKKEYSSKEVELEQNDWIKVLQNSPEVLSMSIAIIGDKFIRIENPSDFEKYLKLDNGDIKNQG